MFRRPSELLPFAHGTQANKSYHKLRFQVLDSLSRACQAPKSKRGARPVIHEIVTSAAAALDVCSLYAYDQLDACKHIMDVVLQNRSSFEGMPLFQRAEVDFCHSMLCHFCFSVLDSFRNT
jgi:hypothetical protein